MLFGLPLRFATGTVQVSRGAPGRDSDPSRACSKVSGSGLAEGFLGVAVGDITWATAIRGHHGFHPCYKRAGSRENKAQQTQSSLWSVAIWTWLQMRDTGTPHFGWLPSVLSVELLSSTRKGFLKDIPWWFTAFFLRFFSFFLPVGVSI